MGENEQPKGWVKTLSFIHAGLENHGLSAANLGTRSVVP